MAAILPCTDFSTAHTIYFNRAHAAPSVYRTDYRTAYREEFDALTKERKREDVAARTRSILADVARRQGWHARSEIERRRRFLRQARYVTRRGACGRQRG